jgi:CDP-diacylglycerol---serine O-phosphatidyltransferase
MSEPDDQLKIPFLPNLMTAGNLCCGFLAILCVFYAEIKVEMSGTDTFIDAKSYYNNAILLIFGACIFDLLDGRMARLIGQDSPFGREFDSLADIVSFGLAPAMLMARTVLFALPNNVGWGIAMLYVLCGAMRLARFNCLAIMPKKIGENNDFKGIPIPMAAGFIASLTILIMHYEQGNRDIGNWKYMLAAAMVGLSFLMMSKVKYPSFKKIDFRTKGSLWAIPFAAIVILLMVSYRYEGPVILFTIYLIYGLVRPLISKGLRKDIEWDEEDDSAAKENES